MLPIDSLVTVDTHTSAMAIEDVAASSGYSRIPVTDANGLVGYVHLKDVIDLDEPAATAAGLLRPMARIEVTTDLRDALEIMRNTGAHLAIVVDDEMVVGVVALEDVLEELIGEIRDTTHEP